MNVHRPSRTGLLTPGMRVASLHLAGDAAGVDELDRMGLPIPESKHHPIRCQSSLVKG